MTMATLNVNVYFRVANLLDRRNVVSVFGYTGSPTDDGYLASVEGQSFVNGISASIMDNALYGVVGNAYNSMAAVA